MFKVPKIAVAGIAGMLIVTSICLTGCGSDISSSSSSPQQSSTPSGQQPPASSGQQSGQQPPARGNDQNMKNMLAKAAEILGISTDKLTSAFEEAQASLRPAGQQPPSGQQPSEGQQPPQGGQPPSGQQPSQGDQQPQGGPNIQALYDKMAETLGISADKITDAFEQAAKSLQK